jgi:hypothetical protein
VAWSEFERAAQLYHKKYSHASRIGGWGLSFG